MLKVGDRLLCKATDFSSQHNKLISVYYTITDIVDNRIYFDDDYCNLVGDVALKTYRRDRYSLNKNDDFYIWEYFYTPQEVRRMKLERLKQC